MTTRPLSGIIALSLTLVPASDALASMEHIQPNGQEIEATLTAEDLDPIPASCPRSDPSHWRDVYRFDALVGQSLEIEFAGEFDGYLYLHGPDGEEIARNDDHLTRLTAHIAATVTQGGPQFLIVTSFHPGVGGDYTLRVRAGSHSATLQPDRPLRLGDPISGELERGDRTPLADRERGLGDHASDGFQFQSLVGQELQLLLEADFDCVLYLTDTRGQVFASSDDTQGRQNRSEIVHTFVSDAPHRAVVTSYDPGVEGAYTLTLQGATPEVQILPEFTLSWPEGVPLR